MDAALVGKIGSIHGQKVAEADQIGWRLIGAGHTVEWRNKRRKAILSESGRAYNGCVLGLDYKQTRQVGESIRQCWV
jgi:hypothetical protein